MIPNEGASSGHRRATNSLSGLLLRVTNCACGAADLRVTNATISLHVIVFISRYLLLETLWILGGSALT